MSTSSSNKFLIIISVISLFLFVLYLTTDLIQQTKNLYQTTFLSKKDQQITYYQWSNQHGEMIISQNKPTAQQDYITFQASSDLVKNENKIDHELIKQSNEYRKIIKEDGNKRVSERDKQRTVFSKNSPLNAINKTKTCIALSNQLAEANRNGEDISELRKQHADECL
jgi:hypothetical protein